MGERVLSKSEKSEELDTRTKAFLSEAKAKGLIESCRGSLADVLNDIAGKALAGCADDAFMEKLDQFGSFYNDPETQRVMPFFGIEVCETDAGDIQLVFAD